MNGFYSLITNYSAAGVSSAGVSSLLVVVSSAVSADAVKASSSALRFAANFSVRAIFTFVSVSIQRYWFS